MGALSRALDRISALVPERKVAVGAQIPTWESGTAQNPRYNHNYFRYAMEGYGRNELVFACVEELATSAAEPRLQVCLKKANKVETVHDHPILDLFENPNPFMSRYSLIASLIMYRAVSGNAYLEKVRSASGAVVQLWPLRPDRMFVIPDRTTHIRGYEYRLEGDAPVALRTEDVIHFRSRNPLDDYYGLPPLAVCAERVDTDAMMRAFTLSFFRNAGVPKGLLNIHKQVSKAERQAIRDQFRAETGGPQNWHQLAVMDGTEASYTPMGMPLGASGIVLPELDEISEARIAMAFGVPLELLGARLGHVHGNRSTTLAARGTFWDETLVPLYGEVAADLSRGLVEEPWTAPVDYLEFDLSTVKALQEDDDAKHTRIRADLAAGVLSLQEARVAIGQKADYAPGAILVINEQLVPQVAADAIAAPVPRPPVQNAIPGLGVPPPAPNGKKPVDMAALQALAAGKDA